MENNQLSILLIVVNTICGLALAVAYFLRRSGDSKKAEADDDLEKTKTISNSMNQLLELFKSQLLINEASRQERVTAFAAFQTAQTRSDENYQVLKNVMDDNTKFLQGVMIKEIRELRTALTTSNQQNFKIMGQEIGAAIANELALREGTANLYPFPEFDDPEWKETTISPTKGQACVYKRPSAHEAFVVKSAAGCIDKSEKVRLADRPGDFYAIFLYVSGLWGWILKSEVTTDLNQLKALVG